MRLILKNNETENNVISEWINNFGYSSVYSKFMLLINPTWFHDCKSLILEQ